jgi:hypothetical protein
LTAVYLVAIQYYTRIGGKVSVNLIKYENNQGEESSSASLVYKVNTVKWWCFVLYFWLLTLFPFLQMQVFGLYFMQSYIGLFYHASLYRDILALRQVLIQRLIVSQACLQHNCFTVQYVCAIVSYWWYVFFFRYWKIWLRIPFLTSSTVTKST